LFYDKVRKPIVLWKDRYLAMTEQAIIGRFLKFWVGIEPTTSCCLATIKFRVGIKPTTSCCLATIKVSSRNRTYYQLLPSNHHFINSPMGVFSVILLSHPVMVFFIHSFNDEKWRFQIFSGNLLAFLITACKLDHVITVSIWDYLYWHKLSGRDVMKCQAQLFSLPTRFWMSVYVLSRLAKSI